MNKTLGGALVGAGIGALYMAINLSLTLPQANGQEAPAPDPRVDATWEMVTYPGNAAVRRTRVPTGWLVIISENGCPGLTTMLVPDPKHQWLNVEAEKTTFGAYVDADRATYEALVPDLERYIKYVSRNPRKSRIQKTLDSWNARIKAAEDSVR